MIEPATKEDRRINAPPRPRAIDNVRHALHPMHRLYDGGAMMTERTDAYAAANNACFSPVVQSKRLRVPLHFAEALTADRVA